MGDADLSGNRRDDRGASSQAVPGYTPVSREHASPVIPMTEHRTDSQSSGKEVTNVLPDLSCLFFFHKYKSRRTEICQDAFSGNINRNLDDKKTSLHFTWQWFFFPYW